VRPIRVVRVYKRVGGGGVARRLVELLPCLREELEVRVLCYRGRGDLAGVLERDGIPVDVIPMGPKWAPWNVWRYVTYFRRIRPHVVHTHEYTANTLMVMAAKWAGVPVRVRHVHTMEPWGRGRRSSSRIRVDRWAASNSQLTLAVSRAVQEHYLSRTELSARSCRVLYNGVDLKRFARAREAGQGFRKEFGIPPGAQVVGTVGRIAAGKGHDLFLRAAASLLRKRPETRFLVVGDGGGRLRAEALAGELGVAGRVVFPGHREDVPAALGAMDVFVCPSRSEGFPGVVLEALAAGVPVVAFDLPSVREAFGRSRCGRLVAVGDAGALAAAVAELLADRGALGSARAEASKRAEEFSVERVALETVGLYRGLLAEEQRGSLVR